MMNDNTVLFLVAAGLAFLVLRARQPAPPAPAAPVRPGDTIWGTDPENPDGPPLVMS